MMEDPKWVNLGPVHNADHEYDDDCPGCQPAMMDTETRTPLPDNHPNMVKLRAAWKKVPMEQKRGWHRVILQGSKNPIDLQIAQTVANFLQAELQ